MTPKLLMVASAGEQRTATVVPRRYQYSLAVLLTILTLAAIVAALIGYHLRDQWMRRFRPSLQVSKTEYIDINPARRLIAFHFRATSTTGMSFNDFEPFGDVDEIQISHDGVRQHYVGNNHPVKWVNTPPRPIPEHLRQACEAIRQLVAQEVNIEELEWYEVSNYRDLPKRHPHSSFSMTVPDAEAQRVWDLTVP